ncbi:MAG: hypothetical protein JEZ12_05845 [Desulfobacterium sp.]|nr:hypothetical protein [Desulfobacterium sp.]
MVDYTIKPGIGLGNICFGATMEACREYFGKPEEELKEEFEGDEYTSWYYGGGDIALCFEGSEDNRLGTIIISRGEALLDNENIIGKSLEDIKKYLKKNAYFYLEEEDEISPSMRLINVGALECCFMFTDDILDGVQWSYFWEDDETPKWPTIQ